MPRPKKKSVVLPKAEKRLSGMRSIESELDFGNGLSNAAFESSMYVVRDKLDVYNTLLSKLDEAYSDFEQAEQMLATISENMLLSVAIRYGKKSTQYEMAGGVRRSDRRRSAQSAGVESLTA